MKEVDTKTEMILFIGLFILVSIAGNMSITKHSAYGQQSIANQDSFLARGSINSLDIINPTIKYILTGNWDLIMNNGSLLSFRADIGAIKADATNPHTHTIVIDGTNASRAIKFNNGTSILAAVSDVMTNGRIIWHDVGTVIKIVNGKTITITLNDAATRHHFAGQPILGLVTSIKPCPIQPIANMAFAPSCA